MSEVLRHMLPDGIIAGKFGARRHVARSKDIFWAIEMVNGDKATAALFISVPGGEVTLFAIVQTRVGRLVRVSDGYALNLLGFSIVEREVAFVCPAPTGYHFHSVM